MTLSSLISPSVFLLALTTMACYGPNFNQSCFSCTQSSDCPGTAPCIEGQCAGGSCVPSPPGMVQVTGGTFTMGSTPATDPAARSDEAPLRRVAVGSFFLDRTEVTVGAYRQCKACSAPAVGPNCTFTVQGGDRESLPVNCVDAAQAAAYCQAQGKRLPTEVEWEYAARGSADSLYPWGNQAPGTTSACWKKSAPCPVGSFSDTLLGSEVASGTGLVDLAGNLWEWTATTYCLYDGGGCTGAPVLRGGAFNRTDAATLRGAQRNATNGQPVDAGFRCAR